jgi:hypothetical protein
MGLYTGFVQGGVTFDDAGTAKLLPFEDTIAEAELSITGDLLFAETFGFDGIVGKSAACFHKREVGLKFMSNDISWAFLQAALAQVATTRTAPININETHVVGAGGTVTLDHTPSVGQPIIVADIEGKHYANTAVAAVVTITSAPPVGSRVTVSYSKAAPGTATELAIGTGKIIKEMSLYGRFYGCPDELLVIVPRVVVKPNVTLGVKSGSSASAALEAMALRDVAGNFAYILRE